MPMGDLETDFMNKVKDAITMDVADGAEIPSLLR